METANNPLNPNYKGDNQVEKIVSLTGANNKTIYRYILDCKKGKTEKFEMFCFYWYCKLNEISLEDLERLTPKP